MGDRSTVDAFLEETKTPRDPVLFYTIARTRMLMLVRHFEELERDESRPHGPLQPARSLRTAFREKRWTPELEAMLTDSFDRGAPRRRALFSKIAAEFRALIGDYEPFFCLLEEFTTMPGFIDTAWLRHHPALAPVREDERFKRALGRTERRADDLRRALRMSGLLKH